MISFSSTFFLSQRSFHNVLWNSYNRPKRSKCEKKKYRSSSLQSEDLVPDFWGLEVRCSAPIAAPVLDFALPACPVSRRLFCLPVPTPRSSTRNMWRSVQPEPPLRLIRGVFATASTETLELWVKMEGAVVHRDRPPNMVAPAGAENGAAKSAFQKSQLITTTQRHKEKREECD